MADKRAMIALVTASLLIAVSCTVEFTPDAAPAPAERFATEYLMALRDSGVAAVVSRTKPATVELSGFAATLETLRTVLTSQSSDLVVARSEVTRPARGPTVTKLVFEGTRSNARYHVELWIEEEAGQHLVETVYFGPPRSQRAG
jgi:hypothetical protein